jgi:hypothetical protein
MYFGLYDEVDGHEYFFDNDLLYPEEDDIDQYPEYYNVGSDF